MIKFKENFINEFLWSCAGVNKEILRLYPNEYAKYAGSGGTILFTALMAMISGGYAMFFVFNSVILSMIFAIFWGLLIFNLDRFIVNSMHTDGKDTLSWKKIKAAMPRIIMAIFLGIVISTPLEMKIFNDRIESQLLKDNIERINEAKKESNDYITLNTLQKEQNLLSTERNKLVSDLQNAQKELKEEAEGNALSGIAGHGSIYKDKETYVIQCKQSLSEWDNLHKNHLSDIQKRIAEVNTHIENFEGKIENLKEDGFSARYEAFSNLKNNNLSLNIVSFMITMLFIIIEVTPTFFKLIMVSGPYETHLQMENYKVNAIVNKQKDDIETQLFIDNFCNKKKIEEVQKSYEIQEVKNKNKTDTISNNKEKLNAITYSSNDKTKNIPNQKIKSNTTIITNKKKNNSPDKVINNKGQLVLNFSSHKTANYL